MNEIFIGYIVIMVIFYLTALYIELFISSNVKILWIPRDLWIGLFINFEKKRYYLALIPTLIIFIDMSDEQYL